MLEVNNYLSPNIAKDAATTINNGIKKRYRKNSKNLCMITPLFTNYLQISFTTITTCKLFSNHWFVAVWTYS